MTIKINGTEYDLIMDGSDIIAQGLLDEIIFPGGADLLNAEAAEACALAVKHMDREEYKWFINNSSKSTWISDYCKENADEWVKSNLHLGSRVDNNLN